MCPVNYNGGIKWLIYQMNYCFRRDYELCDPWFEGKICWTNSSSTSDIQEKITLNINDHVTSHRMNFMKIPKSKFVPIWPKTNNIILLWNCDGARNPKHDQWSSTINAFKILVLSFVGISPSLQLSDWNWRILDQDDRIMFV